MDSTASKRPSCFIEEDVGLASVADKEVGFSGTNHHPFFSRTLYHTALERRNSLLFPSPAGSPRSARFSDGRFHDHHHRPHFLDSCFLCRKPLGNNKDIFMYRGDTPFCSVECREEQMDMDEAKEKSSNLSASMKALRKDQKKSKSTSPNKAQAHPLRTGTMAAA